MTPALALTPVSYTPTHRTGPGDAVLRLRAPDGAVVELVLLHGGGVTRTLMAARLGGRVGGLLVAGDA